MSGTTAQRLHLSSAASLDAAVSLAGLTRYLPPVLTYKDGIRRWTTRPVNDGSTARALPGAAAPFA